LLSILAGKGAAVCFCEDGRLQHCVFSGVRVSMLAAP
jgi:hypothetical protein